MKPIIMSTEDARALLGGRKTMKRTPIVFTKPYNVRKYNGMTDDGKHILDWSYTTSFGEHFHGWEEMKAPYNVGDVLYVRETWRVEAWDDEGSICVDYKADGFVRREWLKISDCDLYEELWQQSSDDAREANATIDEDGSYTWLPGQAPTRWRSPISMPREVARLFLRVTDVRVERVQDIFASPPGPNSQVVKEGFEFGCDFIAAWNNKNAKRGYGWDTNPFCWVIEFECIEKGAES